MTLWFYHIGLCCISNHFANPKLGGKNVKRHGLIHKKIEINWSIAKVAIFNPRLAQNPTINCRNILGSGAFIRPCIVNLFMVLDYRARQPFLMKMIAILAYRYRMLIGCVYFLWMKHVSLAADKQAVFAWNLKI